MRPDTKHSEKKQKACTPSEEMGRLKHSRILECSSHFSLQLILTRIACTQKPPLSQPQHTKGLQPDTHAWQRASSHDPNTLLTSQGLLLLRGKKALQEAHGGGS